ncbi:winged helix-turn-helix domain-containing protein [Streptomyces sp. NPDC059740]|uniref:winged helix-turn-helix domain-containing protein n=1 Tax=Streptomyces sp. NPDC059740 TaxID=3346926 RepID=UPI00366A3295
MTDALGSTDLLRPDGRTPIRGTAARRGTDGPSAVRSAPLRGRARLRAIPSEETRVAAGLLGPAATWHPAPEHDQPAHAGRPAMVGYLVLVPADRPIVAEAAPAPAPPPAPSPSPVPVRPGAPAAYSGAQEGAAARPVAASGESEGEGGTPSPAALRLRVDRERRTVHVDGRALSLTYLEFELLAHLVEHPHRVHTREQLVATVWGYGHVGDGRTVDVHVARLRRKLGPGLRRAIVTVRRVGYKYAPPGGLG